MRTNPPHGLRKVLVALALAAVACGQPGPDDKQIRSVFERYRNDLLDGSGNKAVALLSRSTIEHYARLKQLALFSQRAELQDQPLYDQMTVVLLRADSDPENLREMSPEDLFVYLIGKTGPAKEQLRATEIGDVLVEGDQASAHALVHGKDAGAAFNFVREGNKWRLDLTPFTQVISQLLEQVATARNASPQQIILDQVGTRTEGPIGDDVWDPPFTE